ncbi:MAG: Rieske 2Fe-2S domain-containing protein [Chloroflexi bacterium]|nr:Rieske 2Fe-2S domain-containing protein [Chloroflexota bacterium]
MLSKEHNEIFAKTDRGTPMGSLLRRYWQPVGLTEEIKSGDKPKQVRVMGEELVLFRDDAGRPALLGLHCSHRGTSLAYGRVEDGGIRCPFHGWLYDYRGRCLEQPPEPEESTYKDKIRHSAYTCQELGGLIFAYMGPTDRTPLLPRYEVLVRDDGSRKADSYQINSNYLQNVEGALDTAHFSYLHMDNWSKVKHRLAAMPKPEITFEETVYGIWQKSNLPDVTLGVLTLVYTYFFMPAGFLRVQESSRVGKGLVQKFQSWYVPIDDTSTMRFQAAFSPSWSDGTTFRWPESEAYAQPGPENEYFRNYEQVDTISGIPVNAPGTAIKGYLCQDNMVNETQGPIVDRQQEHLATIDRVLIAMRNIYSQALEDLQQGRDPKHTIRNPKENVVVYIRGTEELERV